MTESPILIDTRDQVATVTLNRPDVLNAMNVALMGELRSALIDAAQDATVRCVVLRGEGRSFCAGGDVAEIRDRQRAAGEEGSMGSALDAQSRSVVHHSESVQLLMEMPKPTIAVVHGHAVGGGLCLALAADVRLVAESSRLRIGYAARSLSGDFGISYLLTRAVGPAKARELMLLDPTIDGAEAKALGLATECVADDALAGRAAELAQALANGPTIAFGRMKDNLNAAERQSLADVLRLEAVNQRISANTEDAKEAGRAFSEKRAPRFKGR
jgi:2-(1,2-epoxy-1,2-dihydrophenyl)acetyl-CoA isomerase